jgi:hypothetical protein
LLFSTGNYRRFYKTDLNFIMKIALPASWLAKSHETWSAATNAIQPNEAYEVAADVVIR